MRLFFTQFLEANFVDKAHQLCSHPNIGSLVLLLGLGVWVRVGFPACWFWVSRIWVLLPGFLYGLAKLYGLGFVELYVRGLESQLTDNCGGWRLDLGL